MILVKTIEIRDAGTFIPAMIVYVSNDGTEDSYLIRRAGFINNPGFYLIRLDTGDGQLDPFLWPDRGTMFTIHNYFYRDPTQFNKLDSGQVLDVEYIRGDVDIPKVSERLTAGDI